MYTTPETNQQILAATETDAAQAANAATRHPPTNEERLALVHALQNGALHEPDLMRANLEMIGGDLMLLAYQLNRSALKRVPGASSSKFEDARFRCLMDTQLACVRQIDQIARITRRTPKGSKPAAEAQ